MISTSNIKSSIVCTNGPRHDAVHGPISIMWDLENCRVPSNVRPEDVAGNIMMALRVNPEINGAVTVLSAYADFNAFPKTVRKGLQSTGVKLIDVPNEKKDAADKAILVDMFLFALDNPPPASIMLISGDVDFAPALHVLGQRGYTVMIFIPSSNVVSSALCNAGRFVWDWPSVARGEGFMPPPKPCHVSVNTDGNDDKAIVYKCRSQKIAKITRKAKVDNYQCGLCDKPVSVRKAVSCRYCNGFHKVHAMKLSEAITSESAYACRRCKRVKTDSMLGKRKRRELQDADNNIGLAEKSDKVHQSVKDHSSLGGRRGPQVCDTDLKKTENMKKKKRNKEGSKKKKTRACLFRKGCAMKLSEAIISESAYPCRRRKQEEENKRKVFVKKMKNLKMPLRKQKMSRIKNSQKK